MKEKSIFKADMESGNFYHVYNQTNNSEPLFKSNGNRMRFINKMHEYISPFAHILAFNLMLNHFHATIEIKSKEEILQKMTKKEIDKLSFKCRELVLEEEDNLPKIMENRFQAFFNSYIKYFNPYHGRKGNLFHKSFSRKEIHNRNYLQRAIYYVHANSIHHGITKTIIEDDWTSFHWADQRNTSIIQVPRLFDIYGGEENFLNYHKKGIVMTDEDGHYIIEEEDIFLAKLALKKDRKIDLELTSLRA